MWTTQCEYDPLLVIGILPAEGFMRAARARSNMENASGSCRPPDVLTRFVVRAETAGQAAHTRLHCGRRQQAAAPGPRRLEHGDDVVSLATPDGSAWLRRTVARGSRTHCTGSPPTSLARQRTTLRSLTRAALRAHAPRRQSHALVGADGMDGNGDIEHPRVGCWGGGFGTIRCSAKESRTHSQRSAHALTAQDRSRHSNARGRHPLCATGTRDEQCLPSPVA